MPDDEITSATPPVHVRDLTYEQIAAWKSDPQGFYFKVIDGQIRRDGWSNADDPEHSSKQALVDDLLDSGKAEFIEWTDRALALAADKSPFERAVDAETSRWLQRALGREGGQRALASMRFSPPDDPPLDGGEWLEREDEPLRFAVDGPVKILYGEPDRPAIWTLSGMFKFGKTTFVADLVRCAADGVRWGGDLCGLDVNLDEGRRIVHTNYEVADQTLRQKFYRPLGIVRPDRIAVLSVRPLQVALASEAAADWMVEQLTKRDAQIWVIDTFSRCGANTGGENDNTDIIAAYDRLLEIGARAGVELVVVIDHMAKSGDQTTARGATAKQDYPDDFSVGVLADMEDPSSDRILSTRGRSSDDAVSIRYGIDMSTRRHLIIDSGGAELRARATADARGRALELDVLDCVRRIGKPMVKTAIRESVVGNNSEIGAAIERLLAAGRLRRTGASERSPIEIVEVSLEGSETSSEAGTVGGS
jgi:hypothetical protein